MGHPVAWIVFGIAFFLLTLARAAGIGGGPKWLVRFASGESR